MSSFVFWRRRHRTTRAGPGAGHGFATRRPVRAGRARRAVGASDGRGRRGRAAQNCRSVVARACRRVCATKAPVGRGAGRRRGGAPLGSRSPGALRPRRAAQRRVAGARARFVGEKIPGRRGPARRVACGADGRGEGVPGARPALADAEAERRPLRWRDDGAGETGENSVVTLSCGVSPCQCR